MHGAQAALQALVDELTPVRAAMEKIAAGLESLMKAIANIARVMDGLTLSPGMMKIAQRLYEALLVWLESVPGGRRVVRATRAVLDRLFYPDLSRPGPACALLVFVTPLSRVSSPSRLVSRSTRSLRGPSAVPGIPRQPWRAALA
ncbi:hypothetical protein GCM10022235_15620 [Kribbella ginsengisoli]|uniref:Uncharacterized protein n=1 Tax=Kribbella ginsengisoli TaxID=363865 RepID=A0ABP6WCJ8_9ACTN